MLYRFLFIQGTIIPARTIISITLVLVKTTKLVWHKILKLQIYFLYNAHLTLNLEFVKPQNGRKIGEGCGFSNHAFKISGIIKMIYGIVLVLRKAIVMIRSPDDLAPPIQSEWQEQLSNHRHLFISWLRFTRSEHNH